MHFSTLSDIDKITLHGFICRLWQSFLPSEHSYFFIPNMTLVLSMCPSSSEYICFREDWSQLKPQVWALIILSRIMAFLFFANDWAELYEDVMEFCPKRHQKACWKVPSVCDNWNCCSHMLPAWEWHRHTENGTKRVTE